MAELLIVVAIIGILTAISIPIFTGQLEKARKNTCGYNLATVTRLVRTEIMAGGGSEEDIKALLEKSMGATEVKAKAATSNGDWYTCQGLCPSGGMFHISRDGYGLMKVTCSKHGGTAVDIINGNPNVAITGATKIPEFIKYFETIGTKDASTLDSQGIYWGIPIKNELAKMLGITTDFDFQVCRKSVDKGAGKMDGEYQIFISDPLSDYVTPDGKSSPIMVTGYTFTIEDNEIKGGEIKTSGTQECSVSNKGLDGKRFDILDITNYKWN